MLLILRPRTRLSKLTPNKSICKCDDGSLRFVFSISGEYSDDRTSDRYEIPGMGSRACRRSTSSSARVRRGRGSKLRSRTPCAKPGFIDFRSSQEPSTFHANRRLGFACGLSSPDATDGRPDHFLKQLSWFHPKIVFAIAIACYLRGSQKVSISTCSY